MSGEQHSQLERVPEPQQDARSGARHGAYAQYSTTLGHKKSKAAPELWLVDGWNFSFSFWQKCLGGADGAGGYVDD